ncbi:hypothetical protein EDD85DRAFT_943178 [Armillaria nabsnona]|nr:hypothetical protein EDD85DRAFT_943178 [Armillaria nabsnona]
MKNILRGWKGDCNYERVQIWGIEPHREAANSSVRPYPDNFGPPFKRHDATTAERDGWIDSFEDTDIFAEYAGVRCRPCFLSFFIGSPSPTFSRSTDTPRTSSKSTSEHTGQLLFSQKLCHGAASRVPQGDVPRLKVQGVHPTTDALGLLYRDDDAEILAVDVLHQGYGHQEMTMEVRDVGVLKAVIGCDFARYGYDEERERVGEFAGFAPHVRGIEYFCDQCEIGDGGDVHQPGIDLFSYSGVEVDDKPVPLPYFRQCFLTTPARYDQIDQRTRHRSFRRMTFGQKSITGSSGRSQKEISAVNVLHHASRTVLFLCMQEIAMEMQYFGIMKVTVLGLRHIGCVEESESVGEHQSGNGAGNHRTPAPRRNNSAFTKHVQNTDFLRMTGVTCSVISIWPAFDLVANKARVFVPFLLDTTTSTFRTFNVSTLVKQCDSPTVVVMHTGGKLESALFSSSVMSDALDCGFTRLLQDRSSILDLLLFVGSAESPLTRTDVLQKSILCSRTQYWIWVEDRSLISRLEGNGHVSWRIGTACNTGPIQQSSPKPAGIEKREGQSEKCTRRCVAQNVYSKRYFGSHIRLRGIEPHGLEPLYLSVSTM